MLKKEIILILDNIRSRENVGSIFRTADAVGISKIYLCGITPTPPHEKISKTALGAEKWVPWEYCRETWRLLKKLRADGIWLIALEQIKEGEDIFKHDFSKDKKIALVVGNEVRGISPKILKYCDEGVSIPMFGRKESLNVSVAVGVAVYQIRREVRSTRQIDG